MTKIPSPHPGNSSPIYSEHTAVEQPSLQDLRERGIVLTPLQVHTPLRLQWAASPILSKTATPILMRAAQEKKNCDEKSPADFVNASAQTEMISKENSSQHDSDEKSPADLVRTAPQTQTTFKKKAPPADTLFVVGKVVSAVAFTIFSAYISSYFWEN